MATILYIAAVLCAFASLAEGGVLFASINKTLAVTSQIESSGSSPMVARAGKDSLRIHWMLNSTFAGKDAKYKMVDVKLCFGPPSQVNRGWRKTKPDISLDRTCKAADIAKEEYSSMGNTITWTVSKEVPFAKYFVRVYALDDMGNQLAFGQTTNKNKTTNLFTVEPISGRSTSIDIAAGVFSAFAVVSLFSYLGLEKLLSKRKG